MKHIHSGILLAVIACSFISTVNGGLDYSAEYLLDCNDSTTYTEEQLSEILIIRPIDRWVFLILGPFALMATFFIIFTFYKYPTTRKQPGDIILAISISDLVTCTHWIISSGYAVVNNAGPE